MANSIDLITKYLPQLDEVYKLTSLTSRFDAAPEAVQATSEANVIKIAKMVLQGLGLYSRNTGYVAGDNTLTWETHTFSQDRGRKFNIDSMDDAETANIAFGMLAGEFIRTRVVPEFDAYRLAKYLAAAITASNAASANLTTGAGVIAALRVASNAQDENEVPEEGRVLYITPTLDGLIQDLDTTASREVLSRFSAKVRVPQTRFYTAITQYDGSTAGQEDGGFIKNASTGKNANFLVVHPSAVLQVTKHTVTKIIAPETNQTSDGWMYFFRAYHDAFVLDNKAKGLYAHYATT